MSNDRVEIRNEFVVLAADEISAEALRAYLDLGLRSLKAHPIGLVLCFTDYDYVESRINNTKYDDESSENFNKAEPR